MGSSHTPPLVIQTEHLDEAAAAWMGERCDLRRCSSDDPAFDGLLGQADALLIRTYTRVDDALLAKAPRLRCVARAGVGLDNVDLAACKARGVRVVSTPGANTRAVVEYVWAMVLDALRPRTVLREPLNAPEWKALRTRLVAQRQLSDLTLGVLGLGRVGTGVARVGVALDMRVLYHDLLEFPAERRAGAAAATFERVMRESDIISVHVDGRSSNRGLINARALALCKPDVVLVNTSRGFVVHTPDLAAFLKQNPRATALIDVHEPEPFGTDYPLLGLPNARLSAHIAAATSTAQNNMSWVVRDLDRVLRGEQPEHEAGA